ncbi:MAG: beta tubulin [Alphaproteobacteria bacterium HGW-Alphaproteobacteria-12]|nr:MAG: beta tubulin [Alphaproteobacteria bacterium HGW-Alphaproteobacteria-12]
MKSLSPEFAAHLASGATTLAWCWKLTRGGGAALGFTDHDRDLVFGGTLYEAAGGFTATALESSSGLNVDNLDVAGALTSARLDEADLAAGVYDNAEIEIWRVNWQAPDERVLMRKGNLGEVARTGAAFTAELRGLAHRLNQPTGRLFQYGCDADFADRRCGLAAGDWTVEAMVTSVAGNREIVAAALAGFVEGHFARGLLRFASGANEGAAHEVKAHGANGRIELWRAAARDVTPGDTFEVIAGCDKQFTTCLAKFGNSDNFRGFPHMPGNDFVLAGADAGATNDGGRRTR